MELGNNIFNEIIPFMIKFAVYLGILLILIGITIMIYTFVSSLNRESEIYLHIIKSGVSTLLVGVIFNFLVSYEIEYDSFKFSVPCGYFIFLIIFLFVIGAKKSKKDLSE